MACSRYAAIPVFCDFASQQLSEDQNLRGGATTATRFQTKHVEYNSVYHSADVLCHLWPSGMDWHNKQKLQQLEPNLRVDSGSAAASLAACVASLCLCMWSLLS